MTQSMTHRKTPPYGTGFDKAGMRAGSKAYAHWYGENSLITAVQQGGSAVSWK